MTGMTPTTKIAIRERGTGTPGPVVSIDGQEYPFTLSDPFTEKEEQRLEWYFEKHLKFPFVDKVKAGEAAASVTTYGHALFEQLFGERRVYGRYAEARQRGVETLCFEVVGSPEFHRLHWEALKDPDLPQPFALQASFVRRNFQPQVIRAELRPSPTINLLVVTARPYGRGDVGYRTISRPLVNALRQANLRVQVDIVRPGTYAALEQQLEAVQDRYGTGYYHVVHFDVHGSLLPYAGYLDAVGGKGAGGPGALTYQAREGRPDLPPYDGLKAFLYLEGAAEGKADPVEAGELARRLLLHGVPIAILNACQSGKQVGDRETSLGSQLLGGGIQTVLAMGYTVMVTAAELLMQRLYGQLFSGAELADAICAGRLALYNRKGRKGSYNQVVDLEDWLLPVVYENRPQQLRTRDFTPAEEKAFYERQAVRYPEPKVAYEFVGRDLDTLNIERKLLGRRNLLLVHGMGGAGKTTLLHHLGYWWQTTGLVDQVFYFGYDQKAWTRQQIMDAIARQLLGEVDYLRRFQPLSPAAQQSFLSERLRAGGQDGKHHLLMLDNLESITGVRLAIQNTLDAAEQARLRDFLCSLVGGRTLVLLGSRGNEEWLADGTFGANVYELPGLDPEAASNLADLILQRYNVTKWRGDKDFARLLKLLEGYPLPLEIVLANLQRQTPTEIVKALEDGLKEIDTSKSSKTESLLACIDYSYGNLAEGSQELLLCLAPFTGVVYVPTLEQYTEQLKAQPALSHLPFNRWGEVLEEAVNWGLLAPHSEARDYLRLQPILPYFLRNRLQAVPEFRAAVETAFRELYDGLGGVLHRLITSKDPQQRQLGLTLVSLEFENLTTALELALQQHVGFFNPYEALFRFLDALSRHAQALQLSEQVLAARSSYRASELTDEVAQHFFLAFHRTATSALMAKQYAKAERTYQEALGFIHDLKGITEATRANYTASTYHQLGRVAQEQRQWAQSEQHYQQALALLIEFNDRYEQAGTYHNLGNVAQAQRQWAQAEQHYQQALAIFHEFNDRYEQADTYHQMGNMAQQQRQWAQAEQHYQQALAIKLEFDDRYSQAGTYHNLGMVAAEQGQWAQAEQHFQQALALFIEFDDRYSQALTYHNLGIVAQEQRQWVQAEQHFQQALALKIEFDDRYSQAGTYHQLGVVAQEQRQWAQAEQHYQQALAISIEFDDRYSQASTYGQLGILAQAQQQWAQARQYLLQALTIFRDYEDEYSMGITLRNLARLWRDSGDATLPAATAAIGGSTPEEMEAWFRQVLAEDEKE
ncbi:MAG: tetratricopeptide repeat protein [Caldilineaceae bacterium]